MNKRIKEAGLFNLFQRSFSLVRHFLKRSYPPSKKRQKDTEPSTQSTVPIQEKEPRSYDEYVGKNLRCIVLSDTDNEIVSVKNTLGYAALLNDREELADDLNGITLFHTGDLVDKKRPDPSVVDFWRQIRRQAKLKGGHVKIIVGNHEQEIWQKIEAGKKISLGTGHLEDLKLFIESMDLFHLERGILFIHGYPTLEFLRTLQHYGEVTGNNLNQFNSDHYKKAFKSPEAMQLYAYARDNKQKNYLLYDVKDAAQYYKKHGKSINMLFKTLKIECVIHGHRPQRSGVQIDYEFSKWLPDVRMIGNDTMVRRKGLGATVIRSGADGNTDILFINTKNKSKKQRKIVSEHLAADQSEYSTEIR
ncbi:MAG: metallophosphoesterase [Candidatus Thiodiazotropha endolucinida]|nr:metallophosphoesterase [Candidatus Thiodiazotropha taylori]MCG8118120.1 metallophosphoesterase [Candidatus Thiodiazotropha taylori]MCW4286118.1 metallophosphoesterase [Candidatus Thiodiazotropha endolucinida]MCW4293804.1 metallophosphoesterase [Candidatus Thiodiazotropha endolucinida]